MQTDGKKYLYEIVYTTLKKEIQEGVYPFDVFLPSERDISVRFDVDRATARKALAILVKDGLVEKRAGAGTKVIYRGSEAPSGGSNCGKLIGFFIFEEGEVSKKITQPFYSDIFYQVELECKKYDANVIYSTLYSESDYMNIIAQRNFSGIIFASKTDDFYVEYARNAGIKAAQIVGYNSSGLNICYDNIAAGSLAMNHLLDNGHENIAVITGPEDYQSSKDRFVGALAALFQRNITLNPAHIQHGNWEYDSGYTCAQKLLQSQSRPTAIYCFNDMMALGAMDAIAEAGLSVPEDISIVSSDNMNEIRRREQRLTTTDGKVDVIASLTLDYFFNSGLTDMCGIKIVVPVSLVEGDTVRRLK